MSTKLIFTTASPISTLQAMRRSLLRPPIALLLPKEPCIFCQAAACTRRSIYKPTSRVNPPTFRNVPKDPNYIVQQQIALAKKGQSKGQSKGNNPSKEGVPSVKGQGTPIPEALFRAAYANGFLSITPDKCLMLRRRFEAFGPKRTHDGFEKLIESLDINVNHVVQLCRLMLKSRNAQERDQGLGLLLMACKAGSRTAVVFNLKLALRQGQFNHVFLKEERQQLLDMVKEGNYVPALMLQANVSFSSGNIATAMKLWTRVTQLPDDITQKKADESGFLGYDDIFSDLDVCSAWIAIARECMDIHSEYHDFDRAKEAYRIAAIEYDDPYAYHHLALTEDLYSPLWLQYHTKAASSGHTSSAVALGEFYSLSMEKLESALQNFTDPALRAATLHEFHNSPCHDLVPSDAAITQLKLIRKLGGLPKPERLELRLSEIQQDETGTEKKAMQRAIYAVAWYEVASRGGDDHASLKLARLKWSCGFFPDALLLVKEVRLREYSEAGDQYLNRDAQALFQEWQKDPMWDNVYANFAEVRALHEEIGTAKKFVRIKSDWGFNARNPALKRMKEREREKKSVVTSTSS